MTHGRTPLRRAAAAVAVSALSIAGLAATSAPASAVPDPGPASATGTWLAAQLSDGLVLSPYVDDQGNPYPDYGVSIDVALAMAAVGAPGSAVDDISDAIAAALPAYIGADGEKYAGATAKAAVLAQTAGDDPTAFGGVDLIGQLEGLVVASGSAAGRIQDDSAFGDYSNTLGQAFAAWSLDVAGSTQTDPVTDFLLLQQCDAGFFRQDFAPADAVDQSCEGGAGEPDVDSTALAVEALQSQLDDTDVQERVTDAVAWLKSAQKPNGSFGADTAIPTANANSTGLAGYALALAGETEAAARAAAWLRAHQATNVANCVYYDGADVGAVAYDNAALTAAQAGPMSAELRYQSVRAAAQALPALVSAEAGAGTPNALFAAEYVQAGGKKPVGVNAAAPGEALCAMLGEQSVLGYANADGDASLPVLIPGKTATSKVKVANADGIFATVEINALGAKKVPVTLKSKVAAGARQVVRITGLAPGEMASVTIVWPSKKGHASGAAGGGQANNKGVFTFSTKVPRTPGTAKVKVKGEFANRKNSKTFTVTR